MNARILYSGTRRGLMESGVVWCARYAMHEGALGPIAQELRRLCGVHMTHTHMHI